MKHSIFDRKILKIHRDRTGAQENKQVQDLYCDILERAAIYRPKFETVLNIGSRINDLKPLTPLKINNLITTDLSLKAMQGAKGIKVQADEEALPFRDESFDLIISVLNLHWVNDLPGTLIQIRKALKKDGLFIANIIGGNSLKELKSVFVKTESDLGLSINFHVSPMITAQTMAELMQRAKFQDIVVDQDQIEILYNHPSNLMGDIKNLAESNCMNNGKIRYLRKDVLDLFCKNYFAMFPSNEGGIRCGLDVITFMGYK